MFFFIIIYNSHLSFCLKLLFVQAIFLNTLYKLYIVLLLQQRAAYLISSSPLSVCSCYRNTRAHLGHIYACQLDMNRTRTPPLTYVPIYFLSGDFRYNGSAAQVKYTDKLANSTKKTDKLTNSTKNRRTKNTTQKQQGSIKE